VPPAKTNRDYHTTRVKSAPEHRAAAAAGLADGQREYFNGLLTPESAKTTRIEADRLYQEIRAMIGQERGIAPEPSVPF
jgi:hypothetical protein